MRGRWVQAWRCDGEGEDKEDDDEAVGVKDSGSNRNGASVRADASTDSGVTDRAMLEEDKRCEGRVVELCSWRDRRMWMWGSINDQNCGEPRQWRVSACRSGRQLHKLRLCRYSSVAI